MVLAGLKELLSKYSFMFDSLTVQKRSILRKIPDIQQSLETVIMLKTKREEGAKYTARFALTDNCHATAELDASDKVCLWLGANVMLEYSLDEADDLLKSSQTSATQCLQSLDKSLNFLRDQITTTGVNIARVHNHNVRLRAQVRANETQ